MVVSWEEVTRGCKKQRGSYEVCGLRTPETAAVHSSSQQILNEPRYVKCGSPRRQGYRHLYYSKHTNHQQGGECVGDGIVYKVIREPP